MPEQPVYNLKAVLHETGLNAETLRAWERRYGLPAPQRTPGGHRLYSTHDVQILKWLIERQSEGMSISRAVSLWHSLEAEGQAPLQARAEGTLTLGASTSTLDDLRAEWLGACLRFNENAADRALTQAFAISSPETAVLEILQKGMAEIGELWYRSEANVQQEHFASGLAMRRLHSLVAAAPLPSRPVRLLAACPAGEQHEFGLLLATFLLRRNGWDVVYLGADVPLYRLETTLASTRPGVVISLAQTLPSAAALRDMAGFLAGQQIPLAFGGRVFTVHPRLIEQLGGHYLGDQIVTVPAQVDRLLREHPPVNPPQPLNRGQKAALESYLDAQPMVQAVASSGLRRAGISPAHLEIAGYFFQQHLEAALALGDLALLDGSMDWIAGLLAQAGVPVDTLFEFLRAYQQALAEQPGGKESPVLGWLEAFLAGQSHVKGGAV